MCTALAPLLSYSSVGHGTVLVYCRDIALSIVGVCRQTILLESLIPATNLRADIAGNSGLLLESKDVPSVSGLNSNSNMTGEDSGICTTKNDLIGNSGTNAASADDSKTLIGRLRLQKRFFAPWMSKVAENVRSLLGRLWHRISWVVESPTRTTTYDYDTLIHDLRHAEQRLTVNLKRITATWWDFHQAWRRGEVSLTDKLDEALILMVQAGWNAWWCRVRFRFLIQKYLFLKFVQDHVR